MKNPALTNGWITLPIDGDSLFEYYRALLNRDYNLIKD